MKRTAIVVTALALVVSGAAWLVLSQQGEPTGQAVGKRTSPVWAALGEHAEMWLPNWSDALAEPPTSPLDVVEAWNELAYAVTGKTGFWRKQVAGEWLGCGGDLGEALDEDLDDDEGAPCAGFAALEQELASWDKLQAQARDLEERRARAFLRRHEKKMLEYMKRYVPAEPSASAMRTTGAFNQHLAGLL